MMKQKYQPYHWSKWQIKMTAQNDHAKCLTIRPTEMVQKFSGSFSKSNFAKQAYLIVTLAVWGSSSFEFFLTFGFKIRFIQGVFNTGTLFKIFVWTHFNIFYKKLRKKNGLKWPFEIFRHEISNFSPLGVSRARIHSYWSQNRTKKLVQNQGYQKTLI